MPHLEQNPKIGGVLVENVSLRRKIPKLGSSGQKCLRSVKIPKVWCLGFKYTVVDKNPVIKGYKGENAPF